MTRFMLIVLTLAGGAFMSNDASASLPLNEGVFGFRWGDTYQTVENTPVPAKVVSGGSAKHRVTFRGELRFLGVATEFVTLRFNKNSNELESASFRVDAAHRSELAHALEGLGEPRVFSTPDGPLVSHMTEWQRPGFNLIVEFTTSGPRIDNQVVGEIRVRIVGGANPLSELDLYEQRVRDMETRAIQP